MEANRSGPLSRNPIPLSAAQEQEVKKAYYKRVRGHCSEEIKAFAQCAVGRTVTLTWKCRDQKLAMNACMLAHASQDEEDRARAEYLQERALRLSNEQKERLKAHEGALR